MKKNFDVNDFEGRKAVDLGPALRTSSGVRSAREAAALLACSSQVRVFARIPPFDRLREEILTWS